MNIRQSVRNQLCPQSGDAEQSSGQKNAANETLGIELLRKEITKSDYLEVLR